MRIAEDEATGNPNPEEQSASTSVEVQTIASPGETVSEKLDRLLELEQETAETTDPGQLRKIRKVHSDLRYEILGAEVNYHRQLWTVTEYRGGGTVLLDDPRGEVGALVVGNDQLRRGQTLTQEVLAGITVRRLWEKGGAAWRDDQKAWWHVPPNSGSGTWVQDEDLSVKRAITSTLLDVHPSVTSQMIGSVEQWARMSLARPLEVWDRDPWLLGVANGVVDLHDGALRLGGDPSDFLTRAAPHPYDLSLTDEDCPYWLAHLNMLFAGGDDVIHLFHKQLGSSLVADLANVKSQVFMFMQGPSGSGKGAACRTLRYVLGPHAQNFNSADFVEKWGSDRHHQWLTRANGTRLAIVEEVKSDKLNISLLKSLSGGDELIANKMRENDATWVPTQTLLFTSNVGPNFGDDTEGMLRRYIPLPTGERTWTPVANYEQRLHDEASAILAWLIRGTLLWIEEDGARFDPDALPKQIRDLRDAQIADQNPCSAFIDECLEVTADHGDSVGRTAMRRAYGGWLGRTGDLTPLSPKDDRWSKLANTLDNLSGVTSGKIRGPNGEERCWRGVRVADLTKSERLTPGSEDDYLIKASKGADGKVKIVRRT